MEDRMPTTRISDEGLMTLRQLAEASSRPQPEILDEALEDLRRKRFFQQFNQQYAALRADERAWGEEQAERRLWDQTSGDGSGS
jgi:predicted transcriptional regulator